MLLEFGPRQRTILIDICFRVFFEVNTLPLFTVIRGNCLQMASGLADVELQIVKR